MDPDEVLTELRSLLPELEASCGEAPMEVGILVAQVVAKFASLDEWLSMGGFLPRPWQYRDASPPQVGKCTINEDQG